LLTQYCGRLIRTETDRGRIVLLDRRVVLKRYGERMLRALPPFTRVIEKVA
jgi:ATP-dependent DNA helicase DinG